MKEVIETCREVSGKEMGALESRAPPGDPPALGQLLPKEIKTTLGWQPKFQDIRTIVESAWAWHVKNPGGYGD